ncbi:DNA-processing protein DprA [Swingsia samuiensis]|uniref:DNA-protecting protein DprA n=1 Tax=Swingsia samuiensis TaxID=1293412 RepID=A0A4Y6UK39_9PROT|nr:DNA-processing protein DprA [Swingsia samuiensis]QDH16737.1 DNA-protecting protein DprA [Swingsia samuiensis]
MTTSPTHHFTLSDQSRLDALRLSRVAGVGPINFCKLLCQYGSPANALKALPERMKRAGRLENPTIPPQSDIEKEIEQLHHLGGQMLIRGDDDYPHLLSLIPDAPPVLFVKGNLSKLSMRSIGIVGARNASAAGIRIAESISAELSHEGICVVSGLARGIDSAAHEAALFSNLTVAAIAGGLDTTYPFENAKLQEKISENGCLITEAPMGTIPQARHFPRRNRLIAGLSLGCLVIEATLHSGTLITADLAASYNRELFSVPGSPLDPRSRGSNNLIRNGAILTESIQDILPYLPSQLPPKMAAPWQNSVVFNNSTSGFSEPIMTWNSIQTFTPEDPSLMLENVQSLLSITPVTVDEVVQRCQFSVSAVLSILAELELGGVVEFVPGGRVALLPNRN